MVGSLGAEPSGTMAAFNRPVAPLGADPESLSAAFTLDPAVEGRGEWINTSTYMYYPEPALAGDTSYIVSLDPALTGADGSPLAGTDTWFFTTTPPQLLLVDPEDQAHRGCQGPGIDPYRAAMG